MCSRVELRRREIGRERDDVAQEFGGLDDLDAVLCGNRCDVVVDDVLAGPHHVVPVGLEGGREVGRLVALHPVEHIRLGGVRVDLAGRVPARRVHVGEQLLPDVEDLVGVQAVELAQADQLVVAFLPEREVVAGAPDLFGQPARVRDDGVPGVLGRAFQPIALLIGQAVLGRLDRVTEEHRQELPGFELELVPQPHGVRAEAALRLFQRAGHAIEAPGDRAQSIGDRCEIAHEEQEDRAADLVEDLRTPLPDTMDLEVE